MEVEVAKEEVAAAVGTGSAEEDLEVDLEVAVLIN